MTRHPTDELAVYVRIRAEMGRLLALVEVPQDLQDFLISQWSRLLTGIYMVRGNHDPDWHAGWETASALINSLRPKDSLAETEQFLRDLPMLLWRLQEGCMALHLPGEERDRLFTRLAMLHAVLAREGLAQGKGAAAMRLGEIAEPEVAALPAPATGHSEVGEMCELEVGKRVCFVQNGEEKTLILAGKSAMGGMYLFTNPAGLNAQSFTHARLAAKFRRGEVRLVG